VSEPPSRDDAPPAAPASPRAAFERMLAAGKDGALLRYSLGNECLKAGDAAAAVDHLEAATRHDARYTAAWKLLGKALESAGRDAEAKAAWERGVEVARVRGDKQAEREMTVFARRVAKRQAAP
jgi:predicted Zn-dependent protease